MFVFVILFIIFFVVYGYRYNRNIGFIQKNVFMTIDFWSDKNSIIVSDNTYFPQDQKITLYNLDSGCYNITYNGKVYYRCFKNNQSTDQVFISFEGKTKLNLPDLNKNCYEITPIYHDSYCIKDKCFSDGIVNAYSYGAIRFIQTSKKIYYCDKDFESCIELTDLTGNILCANKQGIINFDGKDYYLYNLR